MKIEGTSLSAIGNVQAVNRLNQLAKKRIESRTDRVAVSDKGQTFQSLLQKAKEIPAVREDRVQTLSAQIERGDFRINSQAIAEKLLSKKI